MAKQPQVGRTKTRLCPPLTLREAAELYAALLKDTLVLAQGLAGLDLAIAVTPPEALAYFEAIAPPGSRLLPISGQHIGECLAQAFENLFAAGYHRVLALNSDGPSLPLAYLRQAVQALRRSDLVLGPGFDGGYYLVGMKRPNPALFAEIAWSTGQVLAQTLSRASTLGLSIHQTPAWYDIDTAPDLRRLAADLEQLPPDRLAHTRQFLADFDLGRLQQGSATKP